MEAEIPADYDEQLDELRSAYEFAQICHFCRIFQQALKLRSFSADRLEQALMIPISNNKFLSELHVKLIRPDANANFNEFEAENKWEGMLKGKLGERWSDMWESNPMEDKPYAFLRAKERAEILLALCEWRTDACQNVRDAIKASVDNDEYTADCLREEPIGEDSQGRLYFHLGSGGEDCRVYREVLTKVTGGKKPRIVAPGVWETVCTTMDELRATVESMKKLKHRSEKALYKKLFGELAQLEQNAAARERKEKKDRELEAMPRKRSSRIERAAVEKAEMERRKAEEEAARQEAAAARKAELKARRLEEERRRKEEERMERAAARQAELDRQRAEREARAAAVQPEQWQGYGAPEEEDSDEDEDEDEDPELAARIRQIEREERTAKRMRLNAGFKGLDADEEEDHPEDEKAEHAPAQPSNGHGVHSNRGDAAGGRGAGGGGDGASREQARVPRVLIVKHQSQRFTVLGDRSGVVQREAAPELAPAFSMTGGPVPPAEVPSASDMQPPISAEAQLPSHEANVPSTSEGVDAQMMESGPGPSGMSHPQADAAMPDAVPVCDATPASMRGSMELETKQLSEPPYGMAEQGTAVQPEPVAAGGPSAMLE